jgi:hypothetical protein
MSDAELQHIKLMTLSQTSRMKSKNSLQLRHFQILLRKGSKN